MERLDGKYDLESRDAFFPAHQQEATQLFRESTKKRSVMLVLKGMIFLRYHSYCCSTVLEYLTYNFVLCSRIVLFLNEFAPLHVAHSFVICSECSAREG